MNPSHVSERNNNNCVFHAAMDVERIIQCIREGDQKGLKAELQQFNREVFTINYIHSSGSKNQCINSIWCGITGMSLQNNLLCTICNCSFLMPRSLDSQYAQCFFYDLEERERKKVRYLSVIMHTH